MMSLVIKQGERDLAILQSKHVTNILYEETAAPAPAPAPTTTPPTAVLLKPRSLSEHRRDHLVTALTPAIVGDAFVNICVDTMPPWQITYMFLTMLYASEIVRRHIVSGSPRFVRTWLQQYRYRFERHVSGIHSCHGDQYDFHSQSPLEFVLDVKKSIRVLYNADEAV